MRLALMQAKKSLGNTKDNPSVGCVIVKNNHVISSGCTSYNGRPHAETNAITENEVKNEVIKLCSKFPIYNNLIGK